MKQAKISIEPLVIPTYPEAGRDPLPMFSENRAHQRTSGRPYPCRVTMECNRSGRAPKEYTAVHLENDYLDVWVLPEIGGRIFAAADKSTGYDFFYRQHVIKPSLIGIMGSWISGGVEFNWPYHHRPSGFFPCDYSTETAPDGSVICWLSEHEPTARMKSLVGIVLRPDAAYIETRVRLCNRTPLTQSFLWWENAAVPVNEKYQIFFPHDVTYVNYHYEDSRISYPIAGGASFSGIDMTEPRDISWHKNTRDATSYFACASKYDFFGGYDHGKDCGVVHIGDHHISPGKKMFTWAYSQLARSWERTLTDKDGPYAELMASSYSYNQPDFSWLEPYETKAFSHFWYPISRIGTPDFANLDLALKLGEDGAAVQSTRELGKCRITVSAGDDTVFDGYAELSPEKPVKLPFKKPEGLCRAVITAGDGSVKADYQEIVPDTLKMPPVREQIPEAADMRSADELYLAGRHMQQYRDPAVMPDAYWLEALKRDPDHAPSLLGMAEYCYRMQRFPEALSYAERAIRVLTRFTTNIRCGDAYYLHGLILEALGETDKAYDAYYKASWNGAFVPIAMARLACIDLKRGDAAAAEDHARRALEQDVRHPLAPACLILALKALGRDGDAEKAAADALAFDPFNLPVRFVSGMSAEKLWGDMKSLPSEAALDLVQELDSMGGTDLILSLLGGLAAQRPECRTAMILYVSAFYEDRAGRDCAASLAAAEKADIGLMYPSRALEADALRFAAGKGSARALYLLGCILYDERRYDEATALFEEYTRRSPEDYMGWRCLSVACFSHMHREKESLDMMLRAFSLCPRAETLYETAVLMDKLAVPPAEKARFLEEHRDLISRDDLIVELAKAYNEEGEPDKALELLNGHDFTACEGGEHNGADQYMFSKYVLADRARKAGDLAKAAELFTSAMSMPEHLGLGIWNVCKYVPYQYGAALCLYELGRKAEAEKLCGDILSIKIDLFSNMHLKELPWYQALALRMLGRPQAADRLMGEAFRSWQEALAEKDSGFFGTIPFFISHVDDPAKMRRAQYLYLLALVRLYSGRNEEAKAMLKEAYGLNTDNLFCGYFAGLI